MHLSLKKINYLIISLVAFCILSISSLSIYQNSSIFSKLNSFYEHPFTVISSVTNVRKNSRTLWDYTNEAIVLKKDISRAQIEEIEKEIELNLEIVKKQYLGPKSDCEDLERTYKFHKEMINNAFSLIEKNEIEEAKKLLSTSNYRELIDNAEKIIKHAQNKAVNFIDEANNQLIDFKNALIIVSIVVSLLGIIASIFTLRFIRKRFNNLKTSLNSINHDNLKTIEIKENDIQDFIDIQNSINLMTKRLDSSNKEILALKQKYQVLFDNSPDAYFIMEISAGEILDCNDTALEMLRGERSQVVGLTPDQLSCEYQPDGKLSKDGVQEQIAQALKDGKNRFEWLHKRIDGELFWTEIIVSVVKIEGIIVLFVTWRDISKQKNIESQILSQKEEFESLFRQSGEGIAILDLEAKFLDFNDAYMKMIGYTKEELKNKSCIDLTAPEDRERSMQALSEALSKGYLHNFEKVCITKDGKQINVSMTATLLSDKQRFLIVTKDMTSFKLMEEQYRLASMGEMIGNIAHQWRQPLNVISSIASSMKTMEEFGTLEGYDILPDMEQIIQQSKYLSKTIDDFKNYIKDSKELKELSIQDVLEKALLILHPAMVNNYIKIVKNIPCDIKVDANENELIQAFINIMNNARDALKENVQESDDRYIFITMNCVDNTKELSICDTGGGIPQNVLNRVFEPYFTTKHQSVGTGLGLSMAYKIIVERYKFTLNVTNKEIEYNNKKYHGACFTIKF